MPSRTFGWVQEAYVISNLKRIVQIFLPNSKVNLELRNDKLPRLVSSQTTRNEFIKILSQKEIHVPYVFLKGKGKPVGLTRAESPCSGIIQATLPGQRKEFQSDWPADSYLRWAISVGFLEYDSEKDECAISGLGSKYAISKNGSAEEYKILTEAFLSNPPVCRVLELLEKKGHLTKFEIGQNLGFQGDAGFTSISQDLLIKGLSDANSKKEKAKILAYTEGTSDKYARTICSWLEQLKWVQKSPKLIETKIANKVYSATINQAYLLTLKGRTALKHIKGLSKFPKFPKRVLWEMLATKETDRNYLRTRRGFIVQQLQRKEYSLTELCEFLSSKKISENTSVILDDIKNFSNIGLNIKLTNNKYKIEDKIIGLNIPETLNNEPKSDLGKLKDALRQKLVFVNHKYLALIDLGFDSRATREFEFQTADFLTSELSFQGKRLGDSRRPDICIYYQHNGLIVDNKAYKNKYSLPMAQADEMVRYIEENKQRLETLNPNRWWDVFTESVKKFNYTFISGNFTGGFRDRLKNITERTGVKGAVINTVNLLLIGEEVKSGRLKYSDFFKLFDKNEEIVINDPQV